MTTQPNTQALADGGPPVEPPEKYASIRADLRDFLLGAGSFMRRHFGDEIGGAKYWWRQYLTPDNAPDGAESGPLRAQVAQPVPEDGLSKRELLAASALTGLMSMPSEWAGYFKKDGAGTTWKNELVKSAFAVADQMLLASAPPAPPQAESVAVVPRIWRNALRKLAFMACTTGGASGRDEGLAEAISEANALLASPYRYIDASAMGVAQPIEQSEPAGAVHAVALVVEQLEDNEARVRWLFNPVPEGQELLWDHAAIGESATPTQPTPAGDDLAEAHRLGFLRAAGWCQRDDLFPDVDSPTYQKDRDRDLASLQSARRGQAGGDAGGDSATAEMLTCLEFVESVYRQNCVAEGEPSSVLAELQRVIAKYSSPDTPQPAAVPASQVLSIATDALDEIALAGMSGTGQESDEAMCEWHARRAWEFIGIAARAKAAIDVALASSRGQS